MREIEIIEVEEMPIVADLYIDENRIKFRDGFNKNNVFKAEDEEENNN